MSNIATAPTKLKNPTRYHLQQIQQINSNHLHDSIDPLTLLEDSYSPQQFLSNSPLQQQQQQQQDSYFYDDTIDPLTTVSGRSMQQPSFFPNQSSMVDFVEDSPSDYSSSVDNLSSYFMHLRHNSISSQQDHSPFEHHYLSAPSHYDITRMAFHQCTTSRSLEEYESIQINQQLLSEKKRRRRESHNAVERRRRENINERIQELGTMLPETMLEELITVNANGSSNKPNKGAILRKSVDHIKILQQEVSNHKQRIYDLEKQLAELST